MNYGAAVQDIWRHSKGETGKKSGLLRELVRYATLAPSSHNTQCWKFRIEEATVSILPDISRRCPAVDPDDHHLFVSLGCAAENLIQAALAHGLMGHAGFDAAGGNALHISRYGLLFPGVYSNAIFIQGSIALKITIRSENEADHLAVEVLTREAFWNLYRPGCDEHYTTHLIRDHEDFLPDLTFVAEVDGEIVGSIMYTRSWVINEQGERVETATFGPLCVHPAWQRRGVGSSLIRHTQALAAQKGYPAILILGDPHNYCKHGFKTGKDIGVCTLDCKYPLGLLVLELRQGFFASSRQWKFQTSEVYEFDAAQVEAYDARFPPKEKRHQYTQDLFAMLVRAVVE